MSITAALLTGLALTARGENFNYGKAKGEYHGLVFPLDSTAHAGSCYFSLKLSGDGKISGQIFTGGKMSTLKGNTDLRGHASALLLKSKDDSKNEDPAHQHPEPENRGSAEFQFSDEDGAARVYGWVSAMDRVFEVDGDRDLYDASKNPAPQAGSYTLVFPAGSWPSEPGGASYVTAKIDAGGKVKMSGTLADGKAISQEARLSIGGAWPFFATQYDRKGSVLGWFQFGEPPAYEPAGQVFWTRPESSSSDAYGAGFFRGMEVVSSSYTQPKNGSFPLQFTEGIAVFSGADLAAPITNFFTVSASGKIVSTGNTKFRITFAAKTGAFSGGMPDPARSRTLNFQGAVLQNQNCGYGYFLGDNKLSGQMYLGPK